MATKPAVTAILESPLPRTTLSQLYSKMLKARLLAKRWRNAQRTSEAVLAGMLENVEAEDVLVSAGPHPVLHVLSGGRVESVTKATEVSAADPAAKVIAADGAGAAGIAAGMALSSKRSQSSALVVAVIAGKVARGTAWEQATEFAATNRLPVVFVVDCTQGSSPGKQDGRDMSHWPFPKIAVDGRDVIAVYRVTKEATTAARRGRGPTLVECVNFVAPGRRGKDERDPLASFRGYLKRHNVWSDESYAALEAALSREITGRQ
jgi:TPP-dependent pyruvate/acetoin dehydrogenase alpha subunit